MAKPLLQISTHEADQIFRQFFRRLPPAIRVGDVQANVIFQNLGHQAVHAAPNRRQQQKNVLVPSFRLHLEF